MDSPVPPSKLQDYQVHQEVRSLFHTLWGKAHDGPDYNKEEWTRLALLLGHKFEKHI